MEKELKTIVVEQSGKLSPTKMGWIANLIAEYSKAHPESLAEFEKRSAKGGENDDTA